MTSIITKIKKVFINRWLFLAVLVGLFTVQNSNAQNLGFEAVPQTFGTAVTGWTPVTLVWSYNAIARTGTSSMSVTDPATSGSTMGCTTGPVVTTSAGNFLITIGWGRSNTAANASFIPGYRTGSTNTLNPATTTTPAAQFVLNNTTWTRIVSASAATVAAGTYGPALRAFRQTSTTGTILYMDDFITYASPSNVPDLTVPNPASAATLAGTNLNWTNGTDNGAPASGIGGVVIVRAPGTGLAAPTLNDQAMYNPVNGTSGTGSFVSGGNTWTVVANISGSGTTTFNDATGGPSNTYYIFMRDMAYNYSAGAQASSGPCTDPPTAGAPSANPSTICAGANANLGLTGGTGGIGQTYQWQSSLVSGGPYTNVGASSASSALTVSASVTTYYVCQVTCGANTAQSTEIAVNVTPAFPGGTYTINSLLVTGGSNYQTFAAAISAMANCGIAGPVVFNVDALSGPYAEQIIIPAIAGVSAVNTITFNGNGRTVTSASIDVNNRHIIRLDGADYVTLNNLVLTSTGTYGWGVHFINGADNNTINGCTINCNATSTTTSEQHPIVFSSSTTVYNTAGGNGNNNTISNNTLNGGYYGITMMGGGSVGTEGLNNNVTNNIFSNFYGYGIFMTYQKNSTVSGNDFSRTTRATSTTASSVFLTTGCLNVLVAKNRIHNFFDAIPTNTSTFYGIAASTCDGTLAEPNSFVNNLVYDIRHNGIIYGIYNTGSDYLNVYHNTISLDYAAATAGTTYGCYQVTSALGLNYKNNIITISRGGTGVKIGLNYSTAASTISSNNNNVILNSAGTGTQNYGGYGGTNYATLNLWQTTANGGIYDGASTNADPIYSSPGTGNYTPTTIVLDNLGTPVGVTTDILNAARSGSTPDMGAYEFSVSSGLDIGAFDLITPATTGCYSDVQTVVIQIKNYGGAADFSVTPATITCNITGAATATLTGTITGNLAVNGTMNVTLTGTFDMSTNGTYTFNAFTSSGSDANATNDAMTADTRTRAAVVAGSLVSAPTSLCLSGSPVLTLTGSANGNIQWQESSISATGPWTNVTGTTTYAPGTISQTMYYQAITSCLAASTTSNVVTVAVNNPSIVSTNSPQNLCGTGTVTFNATGSSGTTLNWYTSPSGGSPVATGPSYTTPIINATTPYYVSAIIGSTPFNVTVGTSTSTTQAGMPFRAGNGTAFKTQYLYTAAELTSAGISAGSWDQFKWTLTTAVGGATNLGNFTIKVGHTAASVLTSAFQASPSTIVYGPLTYTPPVVIGDVGFIFTTPFSWNGSSNVLIEICHDNPTASVGSGFMSSNTTSFVSVCGVGNVCGTATGGTTQSIRPIIKILGGSGCESPRTTVTANVISAPPISASTTLGLVCNGGSTTLNVTSSNPAYTYTWMPGNLTGASVNVNPASTTTYTVTAIDNSTGPFDGCTEISNVAITAQPVSVTVSGNPESICAASGSTVLSLTPSSGYAAGSIQWQDSPNGSVYTNIGGATNNTYSTGTISSSTYYKALIKDGNNAVCLQPFKQIVVGVPTLTGTTPNTRCGTGTTALQATGSAGATINWYTSSTGGASIGTGSPFTTPVISSTTTFYAAAETGGGSPTAGTVGAGATTSATYSNPFYSLWSNAHNQHLILASELYAAGMSPGTITAGGINITSAGTLPMIDFSLKMANTTATNLSTYASATFTTVYTSASLMPVTGVNAVTFTTPFIWDGVSNLLIEICHGNPSSTATMSRTCSMDATAFVSSIHTHKTVSTGGSSQCTDNATNVATYSLRPQFFFTYIPVCSSTRQAVTATVTPAPAIAVSSNTLAICPGGSADLSVTSLNDPDYTYSWTSSPAGFTASGPGPHTVSPTATTKYYVNAIDNTTGTNQGCAMIDSVTIINGGALVAGTVSSSQSQLCVSGSVVLTLTGASGGANQWQRSFISASGPWTNVGTGTNSLASGTLTQTAYYQVVTSCNTSSVLSNVLTVTVNNPQLVSTTPGSRCGYGSVTLGAIVSSGATANWYANAIGGLPLSTGTTFNSPNINSNTTYYVSASSGGGGSVTTGMANALATATSGGGTTNFGLVFDVFSAVTINSVTVYPVSATSASGTVTIDIINSTGTVLNTATFSVTGSPGGITPYVANVNFVVSPGTNLKMRPGFTGISGLLFEAAASAPSGNYGYPYVVPGILTINTSTLTAAPTNTARNDLYYYFYNWQLSTGCESPRTLVTATVTSSPAITVASTFPAVCVGGSTDLSVTSPNDPDYTYAWTSSPAGFTAGGAGPHTVSPTVTTKYYVLATDNTAGANAGCAYYDSVTVVAGGTLVAGTMSTNVDQHCVSGSSLLTLTGASGGAIQWQRSFVSASGPWTNVQLNGTTYSTGTLTQTAYYQAVVSCQTTSLTSNAQTITVNNPQISSSTGDTRCGPGLVNLTATPASGTIKWYTTSTGGTSVASGNNYSPTVTNTTTYYAAASNGGSTIFAGRLAPQAGAATVLSTYGQDFTVTQSFVLNSVQVISTTGTSITVSLYSSGGTTQLMTTGSLTVPTNTTNTINLGWSLTPGTYRIAANAMTGNFIRENSTVTYPFAISTVGQVNGFVSAITGSVTTSASYYWFYNWSITTGCEGSRVPVLATVTPSPAVTVSVQHPTICTGQSATLSVSSSNPGYSYTWNPGGLTGSSVTVTPSSNTTYTLSAIDISGGVYDQCTATGTAAVNKSAGLPPDLSTSGGGVACEGNGVTLSVSNNAAGQSSGNTYSWTTDASIPFTSTQQTPNVTGSSVAGHSGNYTVVVTNSFLCTASAIEAVTVNPNPTLSLVSVQNVGCVGGSDGVITVSASNGTPNYDYSADGFTTQNNTGVMTNLPTGPTTIVVLDANGCTGSITQSLTAISTVPPSAAVVVPFIGMPTNVCNGTTATLSIPAVSNTTMYIWDAPGAAYFNGNPLNVSPFTTSTPSVTVTYSNPSGSLYLTGVQAANGCGASLRKVQKTRGTISVPASVSGALTACANTVGTYTIPAVDAASSYQWTITGNATVSGTGTTATVTFGAGWTGGTLCVAAKTSCYTSPTKCIVIGTSASTLNAISGAFTACPNSTLSYSVPPSTGAASYTWTLPAGATGTSTTNSINVTYGPGYSVVGSICVSVTSVCGVTSAIKCKTVAPGLPSQLSSISGPLSGLCNQTVSYNTPSQGPGVTYNWTSPGSIGIGQGSTSITTTFGALTTGNVCVTASNSCGSSIARCVPVKGAPNAPGAITATPGSWCANTSGIEFTTSTAALTGSYTLNWNFPPSTPVATYTLGGGNSTSLTLDWISGTANVNVTASNACGSATRTSTWSSTCREGEVGTVSAITVSPNPTTGVLNINYTATKGNTVINVLDLAGRVVMTQATSSIDGANATQIDMSKLAKGAYMLSVQSTQGSKQIKVVVE